MHQRERRKHRATGRPRGAAGLPKRERIEKARRAGIARARAAGHFPRTQLAKLRAGAELTLSQVGGYLGVSRQYVSKVERARKTGVRMPAAWVEPLARIYRVSPKVIEQAAYVNAA